MSKLRDQVILHASIDTYAKKLFITKKRREYEILKVVLSSLFVYLQFQIPTDYRYDAFFASILGNDSLDFNNDVRIISWNYDFQVEMAFSQFSMNKDLKENQTFLNVFPDGMALSDYSERFSIFKINGTTAFINKPFHLHSDDLVKNFDPIDKNELLRLCIWYYIAAIERDDIAKSTLSFAWESFDKGEFGNVIKTACQTVDGTTALVVIGYSFPYFNRRVDKLLLAHILKNPAAKIYIQDLNPKNIIEKLNSVLPRKTLPDLIIPIEAYNTTDPNQTKDQFFLPPEL
jgi:hypothetical protein